MRIHALVHFHRVRELFPQGKGYFAEWIKSNSVGRNGRVVAFILDGFEDMGDCDGRGGMAMRAVDHVYIRY